MCGRYALGAEPWSVFQDRFDLRQGPRNLQPSWNIKPTEAAPVILMRDGHVEMRQLRWGFQFEIRGTPVPGFNVRSETAATTWPYRDSVGLRHCLVPANGFYEWVGPKTARKPHFIHLRSDPIMFMAGLWDDRKVRGETIDCFSILTMAANTFMQPLHTRMPIILGPDAWSDWLGARGGPELLVPVDSDDMAAHEVAPLKGNHAGLVVPMAQGDFGF